MCADHFSTMALPVAEFLALEHGTEYSGARAGNDDGGEDMVRVCLPMSQHTHLFCVWIIFSLAGLCMQ